MKKITLNRLVRIAAGTLLTSALMSCGAEQMSVDPAEGDGVTENGASVANASVFEIFGPEGGPFPQGHRIYRLRNESGELMAWDINTTMPWLAATPSGGILAPGAQVGVTVEIDHQAASQLPVGSYPTEIVLNTRSNSTGEIFLAFQLTVYSAPQGQLVLNPDDEIHIQTEVGASANEIDGTIAVTNTGGAATEWQASSNAAWLTLAQPAGNVLGAGDETELQLFVDEEILENHGVGQHQTEIEVHPTADPSQSQTVTVYVDLTEEGGARVTAGLVAEYRFEETSGSTVHDISGQSPAMDLTIANTQNTEWIPGGLRVTAPTLVATPGPASRLNQAIMASGEMTVEAWVRPENLNQDGPARMVGISNGPSLRNFTLGQGLWGNQPQDTFNMRARTTATDLDGMPLLATPAGAASGGLQHVVYTRRSDGQARLFVDGQVVSETNLGGDMSNWDASYRFALANEVGASRPWLGEMYLVAMYDRALSASEVEQNRSAGSGGVSSGHLDVTPTAEIRITAIVGQSLQSTQPGFDLTNLGGAALQWTASVDQPWVSLDNTSGSLTPNQEVESNLVFDENQIMGLPVGSYSAVVDFENTTSEYGSGQKILRLTVQVPGAPVGGGGSGGSSGDRPGPNNTGPSDPSNLTNVSGMTITQDGFVLENVRVSGTINIEANNVTIRNFFVDGGGAPYGIKATAGKQGIVIEDGELINVSSCHIYGGGFHAKRLNLHESGGDGFKATHDVLVENCWVHQIGTNPGAHADCNQTRSGSNFIFRRNFFDIPIDIGQPYKQNAAFIMQTGDGPIDNILIEDNWLVGGNFTVYIENKWRPGSNNPNYGDPTNARLINNRFGREYRFGPLNITGYVLIQGNRWMDTGDLMNINNAQ